MFTRPGHIFIYTLLSTVTLAGVGGCRKDVETFRRYSPTLEAIRQVLQQVPDPSSKTTFSLSFVKEDKVLVTQNGVRIFLTDTDNLFADANGTPVPCSTCQNLKLEVSEALDKGDIIALGTPTISTSGELMESGGIVRIVASCDGKPLQLLSNRKLKIQIPANNPTDKMKVFNGLVTNENFLGWENTGQPVYQAEWLSDNMDLVQGYEILTPLLDWVNAGIVLNEPSTTFCVALPDNFNPENTTVYLVVKNTRSVVFFEYNTSERAFCYYNAPIGYSVKIVTVSQTPDGRFWLGNKDTEIGTDATVSIAPEQLSEPQLLDFLKSL